jgi:GDP-L-fucose synthase
VDYWKRRRVLVTGGGGFLGTHVLEKLRDRGCADVFVVRKSEYDLTEEGSVIKLFSDLSAGVHGWPRSTKHSQSPVDVVIHLAGLVGGIGANKARPAEFCYQNLLMGAFVTHYAWKFGAEKVVAAGAGCGYPEHAPIPLREDVLWAGFPQQESAPYSLAKRMLHMLSIAYWQQYRFRVVVGIPGNIYGPYDNFDLEAAHVVPALVRKFVEAGELGLPTVTVWGSGKPCRDFVYAGDAAEGLLRAGETYDRSELVNLSSGAPKSIFEVVKYLTDICGFRGEVKWDASRPDGQQVRHFDVSKANRDLGWVASTDLRVGLRRTVEWYQSNRLSARNTA